jgi:hypothetical protein
VKVDRPKTYFWQRRGASVLFLAAALLLASSTVSVAMYRALAHENAGDLGYYIESFAKGLKPEPQFFTMNPNGSNVFGLAGIDGVGGLHRAIHIEPVKYAFAALWAVAPWPEFFLVLYVALFLLPIAYGVWVASRLGESSVAARPIAASLWLYALSPSVLFLGTGNLRPFVLFAPIFLAFLIALAADRPARERLAIFCLLFLVREEAIFLGALLVLLEVIAANRGDYPERRWEASRPHVLRCLVAWWAFLVACLVYFAWAGFSFRGPAGDIPWVRVSVGVTVAAAIFWSAVIRFRLFVARFGPYALPALCILPFWRHFALVTFGYVPLRFFAGPYATLITAVVAGAPLVVFSLRHVGLGDAWRRVERIWFAGFVALTVTSSIGTALSFNFYPADVASARLVFEASETIPRDARVLTDERTHLAFVGRFEDEIVMDRLPAHLYPSEDRKFPENVAYLEALLARDPYVAVVQFDRLEPLRAIANRAGRTASLAASNGQYAVVNLE